MKHHRVNSLKNMICITLTALLGISFSNTWAGNCPPLPEPPTPHTLNRLKANARDRGFLWKISKDGRDSWLYGTIHIGKLEWSVPGPQLMAALKASKIVALEMDPLDESLVQKIAVLARRGAGQIPASLKPRLKPYLDAVCLPESTMHQLHPAMLFSTLQMLAMRKLGLEPGYGVDGLLSASAHAAGKKVTSLETPESQIKALIGPDIKVKPEEIKAALDQLDSEKESKIAIKLVHIWETSQIDLLENYTQWCECVTTPEEKAQMKRLLDDRNPAMARTIDALHSAGNSVLAAVGSLHMVGSIGLPALLKQRGYEVKAVVFDKM